MCLGPLGEAPVVLERSSKHLQLSCTNKWPPNRNLYFFCSWVGSLRYYLRQLLRSRLRGEPHVLEPQRPRVGGHGRGHRRIPAVAEPPPPPGMSMTASGLREGAVSLLLRSSGRVESIHGSGVRTRARVRAGVLTLSLLCGRYRVPYCVGAAPYRSASARNTPSGASALYVPARLHLLPHDPVCGASPRSTHATGHRVWSPVPSRLRSSRIDLIPRVSRSLHPVPSRIRSNRIGLMARVSRSASSHPVFFSNSMYRMSSPGIQRHLPGPLGRLGSVQGRPEDEGGGERGVFLGGGWYPVAPGIDRRRGAAAAFPTVSGLPVVRSLGRGRKRE